MALAKAAVKAIALAAKRAVKKIIAEATKESSKAVIRAFIKDQMKDQAVNLIAWSMKKGTKVYAKVKAGKPLSDVETERLRLAYVTMLKVRQKAVTRAMDDAFDNDVYGIACIQIIGPAVVTASGYTSSGLMPHQVLQLMSKTISKGESMVSDLWYQSIGKSSWKRGIQVISMAFGAGDTWTLGHNGTIDFYERQLERKQRDWAAKLKKNQPI